MFAFVLVGNENGSVNAYFLNREDCMSYRQFEVGELYTRYDGALYKIIGVISKWKSKHHWHNYYTLQHMYNEDKVLANIPEDDLITYNPRSFVFRNALIPDPSFQSTMLDGYYE